jgi:probable F420-dependent oxidoreductase
MSESRPAVAVQLALQDGSSFDRLRSRWEEIEELGVDTIYVSDHFVAPGSTGDGATFEAMSVLSAIAESTERVRVGTLVLGSSFRNPNLVADMARTIDHISGGRMVLGLGAGYVEEDYDLYGYEFGTASSRLRDLETSIETIKARFARLKPPPLSPIPILIGGGGEKVTLRLVAQYADIWNIIAASDRDAVARKIGIFEDWCHKVGRDSREVARSLFVAYAHESTVRDLDAFFDLGCA